MASKPFRFLVGPEKREFTLHSEVVSRLSPSLNALVNGGMKEAGQGVAVWDDVNAETFVRFGKFAYTGDYDVAEPHPLTCGVDDQAQGDGDADLPFPDTSISSASPPKSASGWGEEATERSEPPSLKWHPKHAFFVRSDHRLSAPYADFVRSPRASRRNLWKSVPVNREDEDYIPVLLCHVRLAVLADYHGITALGVLAYGNLMTDLSWFRIYDARAGEIVRLVSFCLR
jgi:hypothetical protein